MTSWPLSNGTPILVPPALTTTSQYTFHGFHPGLLESFLLQPSFTLPVVSRAGAIGSPIPGVPSDHQLNSALKRIRIDVAKRAIVATPSTVHTPQPKKAGSSKHVPSQMGLGNRQKHTMLQQPVEGSRPKGSVLRAQETPNPFITGHNIVVTRRADPVSPSPSPPPSPPTVVNSHSSRQDGSSTSTRSVSSASSIDYWDGLDESIFQAAGDSVSSALPTGGKYSFYIFYVTFLTMLQLPQLTHCSHLPLLHTLCQSSASGQQQRLYLRMLAYQIECTCSFATLLLSSGTQRGY
jgi:hypothetical protein